MVVFIYTNDRIINLMKSLITSVFIFVVIFTSAQDYVGSEFRIAFLRNLNPIFNEPPVFDVSVHALADLTATIEYGKPTDPFYQTQTITLAQGEVGVFSFDNDEFLYQEDLYVTDNKSFLVTTTAEARVYAFHNRIFFAESSAILPTSSLGTEYYVMAFEGSNGTAPSLFNIVAALDGTEVEVTPAANTLLGAAGSTFTLNLDAGEVITISSPEDLTGSRVVSAQNPIAVFGGQQQGWVGPSGCLNDSHFWEEMIPVENWSSTYPIFPLENNGGDLFRVLATTDNTELYQGCDLITTLNAGEVYEAFYTDPFVLNTSEPVLVGAYLRGKECSGNDTGDPNMRLVLSAERGNTDLRLRINNALIDAIGPFEGPALDVIHLVMPTDNINDLILNGNNLTGWQNFADYPDLSYIEVDVPALTNLLVITSTTPFWAEQLSLEGFDAFTMSMGSDTDISLPPFDNLTVDLGPDQTICPGESLLLDPGISEAGVWQDDSFQETYTVTEPGIYSVSIESTCGDGADEIEIAEGVIPSLELPLELLVCPDDEVTLEVESEPDTEYTWSNGATGPTLTIDDFETYTLTAVSSDGCVNSTSTVVSEGSTANVSIEAPESICPSTSDTLVATTEEVGTFLWDNGVPGAKRVIDQAGSYSVLFTPASGCAAERSAEVAPAELPRLTVKDTAICVGSTVQLVARPINGEAFWPELSESAVLQVDNPGVYEALAENECGSVSVFAEISLRDCSCPVYIPNAFTPNGDGLNDLFKPVIGCEPVNYEMIIFDRWGREVFSSNSHDESWNGNSGEDSDFFVPTELFNYRLRYENPLPSVPEPIEIQGSISVIR